MYNNIYEEYIRNIIGYPNNTNNNCYSCNMNMEENSYTNSQVPKSQIEQCYPEIYKIIYPMVKKACNDNFNLNTEEEIDKITNEIYYAIEDNNQINININLENAVRTKTPENASNRNQKEVVNSKENLSEQSMNNTRNTETRRITNNNLRDLIKILIIRELLNRPNIKPPRPPRPPHHRPPFPGFPGGPGGGGPRPRIMPRDLEYSQDYYDIYEF